MAVFLSPVGGAGAQFFDNNGNPLTGGKLYTYAAGTTTPQTTYTTSTGNVAHTNPIILDAAGRVSGSSEIWLSDNTSYKFVLKTTDDITLGTWDNISGIGDISQVVYNATANGSQTVFSVGGTINSSSLVDVHINGVYQNRNTYVVSTGSVTFTQAPPYNATIEIVYQ